MRPGDSTCIDPGTVHVPTIYTAAEIEACVPKPRLGGRQSAQAAGKSSLPGPLNGHRSPAGRQPPAASPQCLITIVWPFC